MVSDDLYVAIELKSVLILGRLGTYDTWRSGLTGLSSVISAYIFMDPAWLSGVY